MSPLNPRLSDQLEAETMRADARDLFKPATRLSGNRDQRHVTSPSYQAAFVVTSKSLCLCEIERVFRGCNG